MPESIPVHVYINADPPADILEAARRGECRVTRIVGVVDLDRIARAYAAYIDGQISGVENARQSLDKTAATTPEPALQGASA